MSTNFLKHALRTGEDMRWYERVLIDIKINVNVNHKCGSAVRVSKKKRPRVQKFLKGQKRVTLTLFVHVTLLLIHMIALILLVFKLVITSLCKHEHQSKMVWLILLAVCMIGRTQLSRKLSAKVIFA
jgi:hypothetical protein